MPVFPDVGSTSVVFPGVILPSRSAVSIIEQAIRSLMLLIGLNDSSLTSTSADPASGRRLSLTSGVWPIVSRTLLLIFGRRDTFFDSSVKARVANPGDRI